MIEDNITRHIFDKTLDSLIESGSVKCSLISNRTCLSLRKHNAIENSKKFVEIKSFKDKLLNSFENVFDSPTDGSKIITAHILKEVYFTWKQLKSKDEMINSLLNQLAKCIDILQSKQSNQSLSSLPSPPSSSPSSLSSSSSYRHRCRYCHHPPHNHQIQIFYQQQEK